MKQIKIDPESAKTAVAEAIFEFPGWKIVQLLNVSENIIFEAEKDSGERAVLRIHRPNYQTNASITSELQWMAFLTEQGIKTPEPIKTKTGKYIASTSNKLQATMIKWIDGESLQTLHENPSTTSKEIDDIYLRLGEQIAEIHNATDAFEIAKGFERHSWDTDGLLGEHPLWGRFWENPVLTRAETTFLLELKSLLKSRLNRYLEEGADFGLIHADVISENVLVANGKPTIIDYDDSGFGFRMYDLAVPLYRFYPSPTYKRLAPLLKRGYTKNRYLSEKSWESLNTFVLLRRLAILGWIVPRKPPEEIATKTRDNLRVIQALVKEVKQDY